MHRNYDSRPIGVFDSGLGGLSVLACARTIAPQESYVYIADLKNAPYGEKHIEQIRAYVNDIYESLIQKGAKALLVACNTATASSVALLRREHPDMVIVGMEPAVKPAATLYRGGTAVLATPATLSLGMYARLSARFEEDVLLRSIPCPGLSHMIDEGAGEDAVREYLYALLAPDDPSISNLVLGCTHYVLIAPLIKSLYPNYRLINGNLGTVRHLLSRLCEKGLEADPASEGNVQFLCTDPIEGIEKKMEATEYEARIRRVWEIM